MKGKNVRIRNRKFYSFEEFAEMAGVSVEKVKEAVDNYYLLTGFKFNNVDIDDTDKIMSGHHASRFVYYKGDFSKLRKISVLFKASLARQINGYHVASIRYKGGFAGVVVYPLATKRNINPVRAAFFSYTADEALNLALIWANETDEFIPGKRVRARSSNKAGKNVTIMLSYLDLLTIKRSLPTTERRLLGKIEKAIERSLKAREQYDKYMKEGFPLGKDFASEEEEIAYLESLREKYNLDSLKREGGYVRIIKGKYNAKAPAFSRSKSFYEKTVIYFLKRRKLLPNNKGD